MAQILNEIREHLETHNIARSVGLALLVSASALAFLLTFGPL